MRKTSGPQTPWTEHSDRRQQALNWLLAATPTEHPQSPDELNALREELRNHHAELQRQLATQRHEEQTLKGLLSRNDSMQDAQVDSITRMSHSMRTPLNAILGFAHLLSNEKTPEALPERKRQQAQMIETAGRRLLSLLDEAMELTRLDKQVKQLSPSVIPLDHALVEIVSVIGLRDGDHPIDLHIETPAPVAWADPTRLAEITISLLSNAFMNSSDHAHVVLRANSRPHAGEVTISVCDCGPGLSPQDQAQLFLPFTHAHRQPDAAGERGLAWPVLQRLANWMGGRITVASQLGSGSIFTLHLPEAAARELAPAASQALPWMPFDWGRGTSSPDSAWASESAQAAASKHANPPYR